MIGIEDLINTAILVGFTALGIFVGYWAGSRMRHERL